MNAREQVNAGVERMLRLAAYFKLRRGAGVTLNDICSNVPGYDANFDAGGTLVKDGQWEAVRKKVRRDLRQLGEVFGILVSFDDGTQEYRLEPPFLTAEERDALVAASALVRVDGIDDEHLAALGAAVDADGQRIVVRVHRHLLALRAAVAARRAVAFRYRGNERVFEPWAVGLWHDRWYTIGYDRGAGEQRVYRLDRVEDDGTAPVIRDAGVAEHNELPEGFDADDALVLDPNNWGHDPLQVARVEVDGVWAQQFQREFAARVVDATEHCTVFEMKVRHYESFRDRMLGFGTHARVVAPDALVTHVTSWLAAMVDA